MKNNQSNTFTYIKELSKNALLDLVSEKKDEYGAKVKLARLFDFARYCEEFHNEGLNN